MPSHIVLKTKQSKNSQEKRFKACVIAGEHKQVFARYYDEIYAFVVDFSICLMVLLVAFV